MIAPINLKHPDKLESGSEIEDDDYGVRFKKNKLYKESKTEWYLLHQENLGDVTKVTGIAVQSSLLSLQRFVPMIDCLNTQTRQVMMLIIYIFVVVMRKQIEELRKLLQFLNQNQVSHNLP